MPRIRLTMFTLIALYVTPYALYADEPPPRAVPYVAGALGEINDNGAWSWFMDERAIVHDGTLVVGSVRAIDRFDSGKGKPGWGNVEVGTLELATGRVGRAVLHEAFEQDDHDGPAFLPVAGNRLLAVYTKHGVDHTILVRRSQPGDPLRWGEPTLVAVPGADRPDARENTVTYSNLFRLPDGRIFNFHRGFDHDPNLFASADDGETWTYQGRLLEGRDGYSPYLKYADDGQGTIHFIATEDHPRNFDNGVYHGFLRYGQIYLSDGTPKAKLTGTTDAPLASWDLTPVFRGDPDHVAWVIDLELDADKRPVAVFSVQRDGRGLPPRQGGFDHRFHYARWDGSTWHVHEIAYAGTRLYPFEDDYTGLAAIDPRHPEVVVISTDADPKSGAPLISRSDGKRHRELFRGATADGGATWTWSPITADSTVDNLRPLIPRGDDPRTPLVWMRGSYSANRGEWTTKVVALVPSPTSSPERGE